MISGGAGRDILVGGMGGDTLNANDTEEDIIITDSTDYDGAAAPLINDRLAWQHLLATWTSGLTRIDRRSRGRSPVSPMLCRADPLFTRNHRRRWYFRDPPPGVDGSDWLLYIAGSGSGAGNRRPSRVRRGAPRLLSRPRRLNNRKSDSIDRQQYAPRCSLRGYYPRRSFLRHRGQRTATACRPEPRYVINGGDREPRYVEFGHCLHLELTKTNRNARAWEQPLDRFFRGSFTGILVQARHNQEHQSILADASIVRPT